MGWFTIVTLRSRKSRIWYIKHFFVTMRGEQGPFGTLRGSIPTSHKNDYFLQIELYILFNSLNEE